MPFCPLPRLHRTAPGEFPRPTSCLFMPAICFPACVHCGDRRAPHAVHCSDDHVQFTARDKRRDGIDMPSWSIQLLKATQSATNTPSRHAVFRHPDTSGLGVCCLCVIWSLAGRCLLGRRDPRMELHGVVVDSGAACPLVLLPLLQCLASALGTHPLERRRGSHPDAEDIRRNTRRNTRRTKARLQSCASHSSHGRVSIHTSAGHGCQTQV